MLRKHAVLILLAWTVGLFVWGFDPKVDLNGDNVAYYSLATAMNEGRGYCQVNEPGCPPDKHFPPGYPALLSLAMRVSADPVFLKAVNGALLAGGVLLAWGVALRLGFPPLLALGTAMLLPANAHLLRSATTMMSEIPFLFWSLLLLFLLLGLPEDDRRPWRRPVFWGAVLAAAAAVYTRTAGVSLLFGAVLFLAVERKRAAAGIFALAVSLLLLPWQLRNAMVPGGDSYADQLLMVNPYRPELGTVDAAGLLARFWENLVRYAGTEIPSGMLPFLGESAVAGWVAGIALVALAAVGLKALPRRRSLVGFVLLGSFGVLLLWPPVWTGPRFMLGVLPLLVALAVWGATTLVRRFAGTDAPAWPCVLAVLLLFTLGDVRAMAKADYSAPWRNYKALAEWVGANVPKDAVVVARKPTLFWLWSGRTTTCYRLTVDDRELMAHLDSVGAGYVVLEQLGYASTARNLVPAMERNAERFAPVVATRPPVTALYRLLPPRPPREAPSEAEPPRP